MNYNKILLSLALAGMVSSSSVHATETSASNQEKSFLFFGKKKKKAAENSNSSDSVAPEKTAYEKILTDTATVSSGMFGVIHNGDDYFFEIPRKLSGRDMLIVNKLLRVPRELNDAGVNRGINTSNRMVRFEIDDKEKRVYMREARVRPSVDKDAAIAGSVDDNYIDPIIAVFPVQAQNPDSTAVVIKVNDFYNGKKAHSAMCSTIST